MAQQVLVEYLLKAGLLDRAALLRSADDCVCVPVRRLAQCPWGTPAGPCTPSTVQYPLSTPQYLAVPPQYPKFPTVPCSTQHTQHYMHRSVRLCQLRRNA